MLYSEIIAVCSQIHTKHKYTVWAERRIVNIKSAVYIVTTGLYSEEHDVPHQSAHYAPAHAMQPHVFVWLSQQQGT